MNPEHPIYLTLLPSAGSNPLGVVLAFPEFNLANALILLILVAVVVSLIVAGNDNSGAM